MKLNVDILNIYNNYFVVSESKPCMITVLKKKNQQSADKTDSVTLTSFSYYEYFRSVCEEDLK